MLLLIGVLAWSTSFLIPGIFCLMERKLKKSFKYLYTILPVTLFWFLIYTFIITVAFKENFLVGFTVFLGLGLGLSFLGGLLVAGVAALYPHFTL
jgi:hypothetical protein